MYLVPLTLGPLGYFSHCRPHFRFYIIDHRSRNWVSMCRSLLIIYGYVLLCITCDYFFAMATIYMVIFMNKLPKNEENGHSISHLFIILITDRQLWYVCVGLQLFSSKLPFYLMFG